MDSRTCSRAFAAGLASDYRRTIANFLALQTWGDERATRGTARAAREPRRPRRTRSARARGGAADPARRRPARRRCRESPCRRWCWPANTTASRRPRRDASWRRACRPRDSSRSPRRDTRRSCRTRSRCCSDVSRSSSFMAPPGSPRRCAVAATGGRAPAAPPAPAAATQDEFELDGRRVRGLVLAGGRRLRRGGGAAVAGTDRTAGAAGCAADAARPGARPRCGHGPGDDRAEAALPAQPRRGRRPGARHAARGASAADPAAALRPRGRRRRRTAARRRRVPTWSSPA